MNGFISVERDSQTDRESRGTNGFRFVDLNGSHGTGALFLFQVPRVCSVRAGITEDL